ncbi:MAG TPA: hypothetical protein VKH37_10755, partial [Ferruginibacter sp.]|nr:hypothetical protein [Ferruginibacter sp.]
GAEMSAPKWGIFMNKVYADKNLGYGKIKTFTKPAGVDEPVSADAEERIFNSGDSLTKDEGNGDPEDFGPMPDPKDIKVTEKINIESQIPNTDNTHPQRANPVDTSGGKKSEKKDNVQPPATKPGDDKNKKVVKPAKPKENDYR